jgi:hypothetical protein
LLEKRTDEAVVERPFLKNAWFGHATLVISAADAPGVVRKAGNSPASNNRAIAATAKRTAPRCFARCDSQRTLRTFCGWLNRRTSVVTSCLLVFGFQHRISALGEEYGVP